MSVAEVLIHKIKYLAEHKSALLILYLVWFYYKQRLSKYAIPGPLPVPIFGTLSFYKYLFRKQIHLFTEVNSKKYGPIFSYVGPAGRLVVVKDPNEAKRIVTDTTLFGKTDFARKRMVGLLDYALFLLPSDDLWKKHRKLLQPAFGPTHLRHAARVSQSSTLEIREKFLLELEKKKELKVDARTMFKCITLDVIGQVAFNHPMRSIEALEEGGAGSWDNLDNMSAKPFIYVSIINSKRSAFPSFMYKLLRCDITSPEVASAKKQVYDLLNTLSEERLRKIRNNEQGQEGWEMDVLHRLLISQEKGKLYDEVKSVDFENDNMIEVINNLKYLDNTLKEAQRLHPVVSQVFRAAKEDTQVLGYNIKKGTRCGIFIRGLHLDGKLFKNPLEFNPDRWNGPIVPGSFMPFSDGPHNCIGQKMAIIEAKIIMIGLIQKFEFLLDPEFEYEGMQSITYSLNKPMIISVKERK
ncbi:Cytochrome P450 4d2 [Boothiomyces macroporosus]|uniref:Cytochrome P450 4d2 n=1 Tax=Boothiomyces macroporosus TaxID=261099 RepID=A0AAD5Y9Q7_9FUNG|nr:Cytochrome P450 4d2 [Boothiomyces macroporosus]